MTYELNASAKGITKVFGDSVEIAPGIHVPKVALSNYLGELITASNQMPVVQYLEDEFGNQGKMMSDNLFLGAPVQIVSEHHEIHCGDSFIISRIVDLGNAASDDILIIIPDEQGDGQTQILYHLLVNLGTEAEAIASIYEAPTTSNNGTPITPYNRNRNSALPPGLSAFHTPTVSDAGTLLMTDHMGSGRLTGGEGRSEEFVLKNNTKYLLRATNLTANNNYIGWHINYYRHPGV